MKLEIKLKDPKYCDGCPFLSKGEIKSFCKWFEKPNQGGLLEIEEQLYAPIKVEGYLVGQVKFIRPQKCIKENGL